MKELIFTLKFNLRDIPLVSKKTFKFLGRGKFSPLEIMQPYYCVKFKMAKRVFKNFQLIKNIVIRVTI